MMDDLDALFATARVSDVTPSDALMARVMADAAALQPKAAPMVRAVARKTGVWTALAALFGGGGVLAGLASVAMAGFFVGFVQPETVMALAGDWSMGSVVETVDLMPGVDALLAED
jgi:hypothetical protein